MLASASALGVGEQVEVDRDAGAQLVEAAEQALRVVAAFDEGVR